MNREKNRHIQGLIIFDTKYVTPFQGDKLSSLFRNSLVVAIVIDIINIITIMIKVMMMIVIVIIIIIIIMVISSL